MNFGGSNDPKKKKKNYNQTSIYRTTSRKRPPSISDHLSKTKFFSVKALELEPLVSDRDHFLRWMHYNFLLFSLFLTSTCKQPLDTWYDLHVLVRCMYCATQNLRGTFSDNLALLVL